MAASIPYLTGAISVDIGGGETGLGCVALNHLASSWSYLWWGKLLYRLVLVTRLGQELHLHLADMV